MRVIRATLLSMSCLVCKGDGLSLVIGPPNPLIERTPFAQLVNCDLVVRNGTGQHLELARIELTVRDAANRLVMRREINDNGDHASVYTVPNGELKPEQESIIYNPFFSFPPEFPLAHMEFEITYLVKGTRKSVQARASASPVRFSPRVRLQLPLRQRSIIWDGHDFYSHHRRTDFTRGMMKELEFTTNAARYSYDFVPVDSEGRMSDGDPAKNESWFGFGLPLYATGAGRIAAVHDAEPDDRKMKLEYVRANRLAEFGNYLVIDHGNGEFSVLGHIRQGSARVGLHDSVRPGDRVAAIGASGSSLFPHLHYQLQTGIDTGASEGLPAYFYDAARCFGSRCVAVAGGQIDTGEIVQPARSQVPAGVPEAKIIQRR